VPTDLAAVAGRLLAGRHTSGTAAVEADLKILSVALLAARSWAADLAERGSPRWPRDRRSWR
jgi:hypothetical protein